MRSILLPVVTVLALGSASLAMAAGAMSATGTIKAIDTATRTVTLSDGSAYAVPKGIKIKALKVGEKVDISYALKGKVNEASAISVAKS